MTSRVKEIQESGQSIWFDFISRDLIESGELARMVAEDGLLGVTSNPSIFEQAIGKSSDYDSAMQELVHKGVGDAKAVYETLAIRDIQEACDALLPVYQQTDGVDGFVSLEVSPYRAHDTESTLEEARRLHEAVGRDNVMIKVPATPAGIPAIRQLVSEGVSVNVTLLFSVDSYLDAAEAYVSGLEAWSLNGGDVSKVASVASFFISRIDSLVDERIESHANASELSDLLGEVAIANAKVAYEHYQELTRSNRWCALQDLGARPQRLLWASTSTKNPSYPDTKYVHSLIGPQTVNTLPAATYASVQNESEIRAELTDDMEHAHAILSRLEQAGISLGEATSQLLSEGVSKFAAAFDSLLTVVETKRRSFAEHSVASIDTTLPSYGDKIEQNLDIWRKSGWVRSVWNKETALWTGSDENQWLGWLDGVERELDSLEEIENVRDEVQAHGFEHIMLLGMGGSSLCPWVVRETFGRQDGFPQLHVVDSIVPAQVASARAAIDPARTLFLVASKSGGTTEPNVLMQYFMEQVSQSDSEHSVGAHFVAITDPGSALEDFARENDFRHVFLGTPSIGGRYSAFSPFGTVPATLAGIDTRTFLECSLQMVYACSSCVPPQANPGVSLGVVLGSLAKTGRDKVTIVASPAVGSLGAWLEQLIAESTGKTGTGLIPIAEEQLSTPDNYGDDRVFVHVREESTATTEEDAAVAALETSGHPVIRIQLDSALQLGQQFFQWEMATAVAGAVLGIHPFNQPDVEASKIATRSLTDEYEQSGKLPVQQPFSSEESLQLIADENNLEDLAGASSVEEAVFMHLARIRPGDYFGLNAYVEMNEANDEQLQAIRHMVRDRKQVATTVGYGPRFLHSTGQLHKGGPNSGVFIQITTDNAQDLSIPNRTCSFGVLASAQAQGDFEVLAERNRRLLRIHLGADTTGDLERLRGIIERALTRDTTVRTR